MKRMQYEFAPDDLEAYRKNMLENEKSAATIEKYIRDVLAFYHWNQGQSIDRIRVLEWKNHLIHSYAVSSANSMLAALNGYFRFKGREQLIVKPFRQQKQLYREQERDLSRWEYMKLLQEAGKCGNERLKLIMETICSTGIRISELPFITAEAIFCGRAFVDCKNKKRVIFIPAKLQSLLKKYMKKQQISSGPVFLTRNGTVLNRSNIWRSMKKLCQNAGIDCKKVFPHNLRHLFAKTFYNSGKDLAKLADVLGHSRIETTRIYVMENGIEHKRMIEMLNLTEDCILPTLQGHQKKKRRIPVNDS